MSRNPEQGTPNEEINKRGHEGARDLKQSVEKAERNTRSVAPSPSSTGRIIVLPPWESWAWAVAGSVVTLSMVSSPSRSQRYSAMEPSASVPKEA